MCIITSSLCFHFVLHECSYHSSLTDLVVSTEEPRCQLAYELGHRQSTSQDHVTVCRPCPVCRVVHDA